MVFTTDFNRQGLDALNTGLGLGQAMNQFRIQEAEQERANQLQPLKMQMAQSQLQGQNLSNIGQGLSNQEAEGQINAKERIEGMTQIVTAINLPYEKRMEYMKTVKASNKNPVAKEFISKLMEVDDARQIEILMDLAGGKDKGIKDERTSKMKEFDQFVRLQIEDPEQALVFGKGAGFIDESGAPVKISDINTINKGVDGIIDDYKKTRSFASELSGLSKMDSAPAQMAMIFKFMKSLDPESVVRETEYSSAANTTGLLDRISQYTEKVQNGKMLTPEQVKEFTSVAQELSNIKAAAVSENLDTYLETYTDSGVDINKFKKRLNVKQFDTGLRESKKPKKTEISREEYDKIPMGGEYTYGGKVYIKGR